MATTAAGREASERSDGTAASPPATGPETARPTHPGAELVVRIKRHVQLMHMAWGIAWFVGYGLRFVNDGPGGRTFVDLPDALPLAVLLGLLAAAGVTTAVLGVRVFGRGAADADSTLRAKRYGTAWLVGFVGLVITIGKIGHELSPHQSELLWGSTTTGLVAALHLAGSAIWLDRTQFRMGLWLTLVNVAGVLAGPGWQALLISIAAGAVTLFLGIHGWLRLGARS
ncbi:transporter [Micromonospora sp. NPDC049559]|uniref:transporter n=1 Tax=Micromonospora sp. NPDC049559 TaxID=3155923 RepID=UPI00342D1F86